MRGSFKATSIDEKVARFVWSNCGYYRGLLGEPARQGVSLDFPLDGLPFEGFRVSYTFESKFLGKIYAMVVEAKVSPGRTDYSCQRAELRYSGFIARGMPFFRPMKERRKKVCDASLAKGLNRNKRLLGVCRDLDLEHLRVFYDHQEEIWRIQARPYGGSVVQFMLPPMSYNVTLPKGHTEGILMAMKEIAGALRG